MDAKLFASLPGRLHPRNWLPWPVEMGREHLGLLVALVFLIVSLSFVSPPFRRPDNLMLILLEAAAIGVVAAGQTLVILTGGIDLSVGSVVALAGVVAAALMKQGVGPIPPLPSFLAIPIALLLGAAIGGAHGLLITRRNFPPFIVTLGSMSVLRGVTLVLTNAAPIHMLPDDFKWISDGSILGLPVPALIMFLIVLGLGYMLTSTHMGRRIYVIGSNETAARLSGVPVDRYKIYTYMLSGLLAAFAGIILIARIDGGIYTNGEGFELNSVAAVIIGGASLNGGSGGMLGTLLGVLIMGVVRNALGMFSISPLWDDFVAGGIILVAILVDVERRRTKQPTAQTLISQPTGEGSYLDEVVEKVTHLVQDKFGTSFARIYFVDRERDALLERRSDSNQPAPSTSLATQSWRKNQPLVIDVLDHKGDRVVPASPLVQSAATVPICSSGHVIGILEVQSTTPKYFGVEPLRRLNALVQQVSVPLDDAWLLECGWLTHHAREALRHLWDDVYLGQCALAEWAFANIDSASDVSPVMRSTRLRQLLVEAIEKLKPEKPGPGPSSRRHDILVLTYVQSQPVDKVIKDLSVSRRQYFYDLKDAVDALAHRLVTIRHTAP